MILQVVLVQQDIEDRERMGQLRAQSILQSPDKLTITPESIYVFLNNLQPSLLERSTRIYWSTFTPGRNAKPIPPSPVLMV